MSRSATRTMEPASVAEEVMDEEQQHFDEIDKLTEFAIAAADVKK